MSKVSGLEVVMDQKIYNISLTGVQSKTVLLEPGVTTWGDDNKLDKHIVINVHEIDLILDGAATIELFLGDQSIWRRALTAAGEIHSVDRDIYAPNEARQPLSISVSANITLTGIFRWSINWAGGHRAKVAS